MLRCGLLHHVAMGVERKSLERSMTGAKALEGTDAQRQVRPGQSCCWRPSTRSHPDTDSDVRVTQLCFPGREAGAVAFARRAQEMSIDRGLPRMRNGRKTQI